ncbi:hypothetical protein B0J14DRAFT_651710 [Halenospora varia]|nr:hypothetical protein B0J14DRAFT_651710 [Halenospora varia]
MNNIFQLPFKNHAKLYLYDVLYDITVTGGEDITKPLKKAGALASATFSHEGATGEAIGLALEQLKTIQAGVVQVNGNLERTSPRNAILIMLFSKTVGIAVFVVGTAFFSSAQLLAQPMAVITLTLLLAAAVFSRAIASYVTTAVARPEPMIHVFVNSPSEANQIIAKVMMMTRNGQRDPDDPVCTIQIEVKGHIFVDCKRVAKRSPWYIKVLGIMAEPFDLAKMVRQTSISDTKTPVMKGYGRGDEESTDALELEHLRR